MADELPVPPTAYLAPAVALPLVEELVPAPDPWEAARRFAHHHDLLFLDSAGDSPHGRYSFVAADSFDHVIVGPPECEHTDPFARLAALLRQYPADTLPGLPPFQGGAGGLFCYGLSRYV